MDNDPMGDPMKVSLLRNISPRVEGHPAYLISIGFGNRFGGSPRVMALAPGPGFIAVGQIKLCDDLFHILSPVVRGHKDSISCFHDDMPVKTYRCQ